MKNWAYGAYVMNSDALGVGTVYYCAEYFSVENDGGITIYNPNSGRLYTADELKAIAEGAENGAEGYVEAAEGAVMGISANGTGKIFWYDADAAKAIVSHTDALTLGEDGTVKTAEGVAAAAAM